MKNDIKVSIILLAYNHEEYLSESLDSILAQQVSFEYEVIIAEDFSQDNTRKIINEYKNKYPKIIKPILRDRNIGAPANFYDALFKCTGEYIAFLEGDDYWTDPHKLKLQVDFLSNNLKYIGTAHRNIIVNSKGEKIGYSNYKVPSEVPIDKKQLLKYTTSVAHPSSMCYRNIFKYKNSGDYNIIATSNNYGIHLMMLMLLVEKGNLYILDSHMSAWRCVVSSEANNYTSISKKMPLATAENYFNMIANFKTYFGEQYNFTRINSKHFASSLFILIKSDRKHRRSYFKKFLSYITKKELFLSAFYFFQIAFKAIYNKIISSRNKL